MYAYFRELPQNLKAFLYKIKKFNITFKINFDLRLAFFDLFFYNSFYKVTSVHENKKIWQLLIINTWNLSFPVLMQIFTSKPKKNWNIPSKSWGWLFSEYWRVQHCIKIRNISRYRFWPRFNKIHGKEIFKYFIYSF